MATENQKTAPEENTTEVSAENSAEVPSDSELFAGKVREELSIQQIFAGDEDFYKSP